MTSKHTFFCATGTAIILLANLTGCSTTAKNNNNTKLTSPYVKTNYVRSSNAKTRRHVVKLAKSRSRPAYRPAKYKPRTKFTSNRNRRKVVSNRSKARSFTKTNIKSRPRPRVIARFTPTKSSKKKFKPRRKVTNTRYKPRRKVASTRYKPRRKVASTRYKSRRKVASTRYKPRRKVANTRYKSRRKNSYPTKYTPSQLKAAKIRKQGYILVRKQRKHTARTNKAISNARKQLNTPYKWGGTTPKGFDCSGLVQYCYLKTNIRLPRTAAVQYRKSKRISRSKARKGDLVFFRTRGRRAGVTHVGIYLGGNRFIHAPRKGKRVSITRLNSYWNKRLVGFGRV